MSASLRNRLLVGTVGGTVLLVAVFSLVTYGTIRRVLLGQFDSALESTARVFAGDVEWEEGRAELDFDQQQTPTSGNVHVPTFYEIWDSSGHVVAKSSQLRGTDLPRLADGTSTPVFTNRRGTNGRPQRVVGLRFTPRLPEQDEGRSSQANSTTLILTVAREISPLYGHLAFLRRLLWSASAAVAALSGLVAAAVVRWGLAPLNLIATQIAAVKADDLTTRVDVEGIPVELVPVRDRLNALLERLEASFERERRFTADVAHELRTPLAGMRSTLEVTLSRTREINDYQTVLADCLGMAQSMQAMTNNLLMLARLDARQVTLRQGRIQLAELLETCWLAFAETAGRRHVTFESTIAQDLTCISDPDSLSMVLSNLLANAAEYTDEGGRIWAAARHLDRHVELAISNTGCTLTDEQLAQIFDRFWRADSSRTDTGVHCGLGLALVARLMSAVGGSVTVEREPGGIFTVRLALPGAEETINQT